MSVYGKCFLCKKRGRKLTLFNKTPSGRYEETCFQIGLPSLEAALAVTCLWGDRLPCPLGDDEMSWDNNWPLQEALLKKFIYQCRFNIPCLRVPGYHQRQRCLVRLKSCSNMLVAGAQYNVSSQHGAGSALRSNQPLLLHTCSLGLDGGSFSSWTSSAFKTGFCGLIPNWTLESLVCIGRCWLQKVNCVPCLF